MVVADSERYLEYGRGIASSFYIDDFNIWYIGYALFIAVFYNVTAIVVAQYLLSFVAVIAFYKTSILIFNSSRSAIIACLLFILFTDIPQWNSYVLTESLFTSFTCFSLYCLALVHKGERRQWFIAITCFVILFTILIKPTGVALLAALLAVVIRRPYLKIVFGVCFLLLVNKMLGNYLVIENYQLGEVIYGVTTFSDQSQVAALVVQPPADLYIPPVSYPPMLRIVSFAGHHPVYFASLFLHKVWYLMFHIRPFWSTAHNLFSLAVLSLAYASFFVGIRGKGISRDVVIFAIVYVAIHILSVGITSDDWDGRFLIPMLPVIFIFSGNGLATWRYRKSA